MIILIGYTFSVWVLYYFSFLFLFGRGVLVIGTFVLGSLRWYILLGLGFVIRGTLFCLLGGYACGLGRYPHCVLG